MNKDNRNFRGRIFARIFFFVIIFLAAFSFIVMALWNNVLADVVHVSKINFWQALGILVLAKILFGGFHGFRGKSWGGRNQMRMRMREKWMTMTVEEREKFKQEWKNRCGGRFNFFEENPSYPEQTEPNK
ncbi:MAG TPA: hypothetical protein VMI12_07860 [Puia sp.]|nr:hypothetical protein [Puia sp.]